MRPLNKYHFEIDSLPEGGAIIKGEVELGPMPPHDPSKDLDKRKVYARMAPMFAALIAEIFREPAEEPQYEGPIGEVRRGPWPGSGEEPRNGDGRTHAEQVQYERERGPYKPEEGGTVSDDEEVDEEADDEEIADPPV